MDTEIFYQLKCIIQKMHNLLIMKHFSLKRPPGGVLKKFNAGRLPYPFIYHFGRKGTPFIYLLLKKRYPFHLPSLKHCAPFLNPSNVYSKYFN